MLQFFFPDWYSLSNRALLKNENLMLRMEFLRFFFKLWTLSQLTTKKKEYDKFYENYVSPRGLKLSNHRISRA